MGYHILTGATGLLGSNLLFDFAKAGVRTAVVVRANKLESARQRIESVMTRWDKLVGHSLPRPVILEGSLSNDRLGLSEQQLAWVSENAAAMIQNAASVSYWAKSREDEPFRTNVQGTRNALEFCKRVGIRKFHHVSTAYVCGRREGRVFEHELEVGQEMNTDYERSKAEGEVLVRAANHIDPPTVYRVAIIIGDARTGYTPTFHGFYVPLKLVHTMFKRVVLQDFKIAPLQEAIRIQGHERKNLVPVDWVSQVMTHILTHPEHHGKTYHIAPERPAVANVMRDAMVQSFMQFGDLSAAADPNSESWSFSYDEFVKYFQGQMKIYESYWKDDPTFDLTNLKAAAPHLPCPEVDAEMLKRLCKFAIESNFGWPKPPPIEIPFNVERLLQPWLETDADWSRGTRLGLQVTGLGGGDWELLVEKGKVQAARQGRSARCEIGYYLNTHTFDRLSRADTTIDESLRTARLILEGPNISQSRAELTRVLEQLLSRPTVGSAKTELRSSKPIQKKTENLELAVRTAGP